MIKYLLTCRSLTYAQKSAQILERVGISATVTRTPSGLSTKGCGYCIKLSGVRIDEAVRVLKISNMMPSKIFAAKSGESYREIFL